MGEAPCYSPLSSPSGSPKLRRGLRRDLLLFSIALLFVAAGVLHRWVPLSDAGGRSYYTSPAPPRPLPAAGDSLAPRLAF